MTCRVTLYYHSIFRNKYKSCLNKPEILFFTQTRSKQHIFNHDSAGSIRNEKSRLHLGHTSFKFHPPYQESTLFYRSENHSRFTYRIKPKKKKKTSEISRSRKKSFCSSSSSSKNRWEAKPRVVSRDSRP